MYFLMHFDQGWACLAHQKNKTDDTFLLWCCDGQKTGRTSMPNIFIAGEGIGGCNDGPGIMTLQKNGELLPKLRAAKAVSS